VKSSASRKFLKRYSFSRWCFVDHLPAVIDLAQEHLELGAFERRHAASARYALFRGQVIHGAYASVAGGLEHLRPPMSTNVPAIAMLMLAGFATAQG
jgi:hypothetical protein